MTNTWAPDAGTLEELVNLLKQSQSPDTSVQRQIQQRLEQLQAYPDFYCYLTFILTQETGENESTRSLAGILVKNGIKSQQTICPDIMRLIKNACLVSLQDQSLYVRNIVAMLIAAICQKYRLKNWSDLFPVLLHSLGTAKVSSPEHVEGILSTLNLICEDCWPQLESDPEGLQQLIPEVLQLIVQVDNGNVKRHALSIINFIVQSKCSFMNQYFEQFAQILFHCCGNENDPRVKVKVCAGMRIMMSNQNEVLIPHLDNIAQYMLLCLDDPAEDVVKEACEFWLYLSYRESHEFSSRLKAMVERALPELIPRLVRCMRFSEKALATICADDLVDDARQEDRDQDIRPIHARTSRPQGSLNGAGGETMKNEGSDEEEDDFGEDGDVSGDEWNSRKCAAATVDTLACTFKEALLPHLLPILDEHLSRPEDDWLSRETVVLVIGAVSTGCEAGMSAHLPNLIPFLIECLGKKHGLLRAIACWTLSRYSVWMVRQPPESFLKPLVSALLQRLLDPSKRVQEAACSAFATLEEIAKEQLTPWLADIVSTFARAFQFYQKRNLFILYDAVTTLANSIGSAIVPHANEIMQPLVVKWQHLRDDDRELFQLFECLSALAHALGSDFIQFAPPIYARACHIIQENLAQTVAHAAQPEKYDHPLLDFVVVSLDLLSAIVESLGPLFRDVILASQNPVAVDPSTGPQVTNGLRNGALVGPLYDTDPGRSLVNMLFPCMTETTTTEVRQSAFALLGDLAIAVWGDLLRPSTPDLLQILAANLCPRTEGISVVNNAIWAIGELAIRAEPEVISQYVVEILSPLVGIMTITTLPSFNAYPKTLMENTAITLGRLGGVCPEQVAHKLYLFFPPFSAALALIRDNPEKESAFRGICQMAQVQPESVLQQLPNLCNLIASFSNPSHEMRMLFRELLQMYRTSLVQPEQWCQLVAMLPSFSRKRLVEFLGSDILTPPDNEVLLHSSSGATNLALDTS